MPVQDLCLLFDLDGTLVDSEGICQQGYLDLVPELSESVEDMVSRYRGVNLEEIMVDLERRIGRKLEEDFESRYRSRVAELLASQLQPMPGVHDMLDQLTASGFPICIASNGPMHKMLLSLETCGLLRYFEEQLFSAHEIQAWKPDPALFLHAARQLGYPPEQCVVVEDSPVGIEAALAAGMIACYYAHAAAPPEELAPRVLHLQTMSDLPELIANIATYKRRWS